MNKEKINLKSLSEGQRNELFAEMQLEEKRKEGQRQAERDTYKELTAETVDKVLGSLQRQSDDLSVLKMNIFKNFESLIDMKQELYKVKSEQRSHTFSNKEGTARVTIGYRVLDRYDDTANEGIAIVREFMDSLAVDEKTARIVKIINSLLKRDKQGNLKANRVVELLNLANELAEEKLKKGVKIIMEAHKPERSAYFIDADIKNGAGAWVSVPLSVSSANFPSEFEVKF